MRTIFYFCVLAVVTMATPRVWSQWEVDGPNARLFVDSHSAAAIDPSNHDIDIVAPGPLRIDIGSGENPASGVIIAVSNVAPSGAAIANVPGIGILNLGLPGVPVPLGVDVIADGISHTANPALDPLMRTVGTPPRLSLIYSLSAAHIGLRVAVQCVVEDPLRPPFGLDLTQCADVTVTAGQRQIVATGAFGQAFVAFPSGRTFPFHGTSYTGAWVSVDGHVTFGGMSTALAPSIGMNAPTLLSGLPTIAAWWANFDPSTNGVNTGVSWHVADDRVRIGWGQPDATGDGSSGLRHAFVGGRSSFSIELELAGGTPLGSHVAGRFSIQFGDLSDVEGAVSSYGLIGHTPGGPSALVGATDLDLHAPTTRPSGTAMIEEHIGSLSGVRLGYDGLGTPRRLNDVRTWENQSVTFTPSPAGQPPMYASTRGDTLAASLISTSGTSIQPSGGQTITLLGKFHGFDVPGGAMGTVSVDPAGANLAATVTGVLDSTGTLPRALPHSPATSPLRDGEGLVIVMPALPSGFSAPDVVLRVNFGIGISRDVRIGIVGQAIGNNFAMNDVPWIRYDLRSVPVSFYSRTYDSFYVSGDGRITFETPPQTVARNALGFVNAGALGAIPTVAAAWSSFTGSSHTVSIVENLATGEVEVRWLGGVWALGGNPYGTFAVRLHPNGDVVLDDFGLNPIVGAAETLILGVSDQGPGTNLFQLLFGVPSTAPGTSYGIARPASIPLASTLYSDIFMLRYDLPSPGLWTPN